MSGWNNSDALIPGCQGQSSSSSSGGDRRYSWHNFNGDCRTLLLHCLQHIAKGAVEQRITFGHKGHIVASGETLKHAFSGTYTCRLSLLQVTPHRKLHEQYLLTRTIDQLFDDTSCIRRKRTSPFPTRQTNHRTSL